MVDTASSNYASRSTDVMTMLGRSLRYSLAQTMDRARSPVPKTRTEIPWHFSAITPEWLTDTLCKDHPGAQVRDVKMGIGHVGTSGRQQLLVTYNAVGEEANLPETIFCKGTPTFVTRVSMSTVPSMMIEEQFYRLVRPELDIEAPVGYHSAYDLWTGRSIHLIEDLVTTKGATFPKPTTKITRKNAENIVQVLAALHGRFLEDPELTIKYAELLSWPEECRRMSRLMNLEKYHFKGFDKALPVIPEALHARRNETWPAAVRSTELHKTLPQTLVHCDVHLGNWYMTQNDEMGLLDWQCVSRGHWSRDLAYAVTATLAVEDRREWEEDLIRLYVAEMNARSKSPISFDDAWLRYRQQVFSALAFWTPTYAPPAFAPDNMQPEEMSVEMIKRITNAIVDLDSFGALD